MVILKVPGKIMNIINVPVARELLIENKTIQIMEVPGKLMKILEVTNNFCSEMTKY